MHARKAIVVLAALAAFAAAAAPSRAATLQQCGLPDTKPLWIEFSDGSVGFRAQVFRRPGLVLASNGVADEQWLRAGGAQTIYWVMHLEKLVGTTTAPADPAGVPAAADKIADQAVAASACSTPWIGINELLGPTLQTPWTAQNAQYRADVLAFLTELHLRGARPFLLLPSNPNVAGDAAAWWRSAATVADMVREVYFAAPTIVAEGALLGSRALRVKLRGAVASLTSIGVPPDRVGLMLGFQSGGIYGRVGLQPLSSWLEFVKLNALAAREIASETGVGTIWSWGWGTFNAAGADPDKPTAACVYLWTRDPSLCNALGVVPPDFDASLTEGQIILAPGQQCTTADGPITVAAIDRTTAITHDRTRAYSATLERLVQRAAAPLKAAQIVAAEKTVIRRSFRGSRKLYLRALARRHVTLDAARGVLADELRRRRIPNIAAWSEQQEQAALDTAICARDDFPPPIDVRLADSISFLRLA